MSNKTYDILKWVAMIVLPATATFVGVVGKAFYWDYTDLAVVVITAFATLLGTILGVSAAKYNNSDQGE
ncbi:phage holin [Enterococcus sp. AZ163]|uniref:phage holin n=1 Tax=Enterococcus sp. AZ163 TaxID=2774638 RepID=UPI003D2CB5E2